MNAKIANLGPNPNRMPFFESLLPRRGDIKWVDANQPVAKQAEELKGVVAVIVTPSEYPVELAKLTPTVKLVQTVSAGTNHIDTSALRDLGIRVANNGGSNAIAVAEHTVGLIVSTLRKMQLQFNSVRAGAWSGDIYSAWISQAHEIAGKTIGIIGLGRIGSRVARRLQGWECRIVYNDIAVPEEGLEKELRLTRLSREKLLRTSDIITLHVPLNKSTHHMISDFELEIMKPTAVLINASRGLVVDEHALVRAIRENKITAAGLDVTAVEPTPPDNPLLGYDNVLITPHMAYFAQESIERSRTFAIYNALRVARDEEPESIVIPD